MDLQEDIKAVQRAFDVVLHKVLGLKMIIGAEEQEDALRGVTEEVLDRILAAEIAEVRIPYKRELGELVVIGAGIYDLINSGEWFGKGDLSVKGWMFRNQWDVLQDRVYEKHGI
jgi:hypothetical protein